MSDNNLSLATRTGQYIANLFMSAPLFLALALPYRYRVPLMGWLVSRVIAPLLGYDKRIRDNLALVRPDLPPTEAARLTRAVPDNFGRTLVEIYSGATFKKHMEGTELTGPGVPALEEAHRTGRPVILVSGHFGNHDSVRTIVAQKYGAIGALFRPLDNIYFNRHWEKALCEIATPVFPRGRRGLAGMVKFLRAGNIIALLIDQHVQDGAQLRFFGHSARTSLAAAELAMKYNALLLPAFGLRNPDGITFQAIVQDPIPHSTAVEMTQTFNDRLEAMVQQYPAQWFWVHRRWKKDR
ncbi:lysophospholipid acyltransferase family protein [Thalassovita sp.]|uniref:lysophospholipid acyltransferase family protein n=1 Tax=Thalassovita sp. TaxID=1979401 RepID=UPI002B26E7B0|nr:lysophospholipid acyltransferase family protein [Thalassovita sp.]